MISLPRDRPGKGSTDKIKKSVNKHHRSKSAMVTSFLSPSSFTTSKDKLSLSRSHSRSTSPAASSQHHLTDTELTKPCNPVLEMTDPDRPASVSMANSGVLVGGAKSVEETVRTFRLYEALRNGETAAISRAIRDVEDESRRNSTNSAAGGAVDITKSSVLHLAVQCAEVPVIEYILATTSCGVC